MRLIRLALFSALTMAAACVAQVPSPAIPVSNVLGAGGNFPLFNSGTFAIPTDANYTVTYPTTSCISCTVTSSVALTATRNVIMPAGKFTQNYCNYTTGGQAIQIIGPSGTGALVPNGQCTWTSFNGNNYVTLGIVAANPSPTPTPTQSPNAVYTLRYGLAEGGDSNMCGDGYYPPAPVMVNTDANIDPTKNFLNFCGSGSVSGDMSYQAFLNLNPTVSTNPLFIGMEGSNDGFSNYSAAAQTSYKQAQYATFSRGSISSEYVYATNAAPFTESGSWSANTVYPNVVGRTSTANGAATSATLIAQNGIITVWYAQKSSSSGTATVAIDGTTATDTITNTSTLTTQPGNFSGNSSLPNYVAAARYVVSPGSHTVTITSVNSDFTLYGIVTPPNVQIGGMYAPRAILMGVIHYGNDPNDTVKPGTAIYNALAQTIAAQLLADGYNVAFDNVRNFVNATTDMGYPATTACPASASPGAHMNKCGTEHLAQSIEYTAGLASLPVSSPNFVSPIQQTVADGNGSSSDIQPNSNGSFGNNGFAPGFSLIKNYPARWGFIGGNSGDGTNISYESQMSIPTNWGYTWCFNDSLSTPSAQTSASCPFYFTKTNAYMGLNFLLNGNLSIQQGHTLSLAPPASTNSANTDVTVNQSIVPDGTHWAPGISWYNGTRTALAAAGGGVGTFQLQSIIPPNWNYSWCFASSLPSTPNGLSSTACSMWLDPVAGLTVNRFSASNLTSGNCVQAGAGGLFASTSYPCYGPNPTGGQNNYAPIDSPTFTGNISVSGENLQVTQGCVATSSGNCNSGQFIFNSTYFGADGASHPLRHYMQSVVTSGTTPKYYMQIGADAGVTGATNQGWIFTEPITVIDISVPSNTLSSGANCGTHPANALWADDTYIYHCNNAGTTASRVALSSF